MTFEEVWAQLLKKRPELGDSGSKVEITAENFRALLRQVWGQGERAGRAAGVGRDGAGVGPFGSLGGIFGRGL